MHQLWNWPTCRRTSRPSVGKLFPHYICSRQYKVSFEERGGTGNFLCAIYKLIVFVLIQGMSFLGRHAESWNPTLRQFSIRTLNVNFFFREGKAIKPYFPRSYFPKFRKVMKRIFSKSPF